MEHASFTASFDYSYDKASDTYTYYSLRQLPFTVLIDVSVIAKDIARSAASVMEAPDALKDVQNYYNEIDRPHVVIGLLTSSAKSPANC